MGMNQPSPEILQQLLQKQGDASQIPPQFQGQPQEDPNALQDDQMHPEGQPMPGQQPNNELAADPKDMLQEVINQYMGYAINIIQDTTLDKPVQSDILAKQAAAIASLVPLLKDDSQMEMAKMQMEMESKQQELEMKKQEMEMNLQMKQAEMGMKAQEHQQKLQFNAQSNAQQLQQQQENHQSNLVQSQQAHESKMAQAKQASQLKQSSNPSSDGGKK
jgi:hypothetical protein